MGVAPALLALALAAADAGSAQAACAGALKAQRPKLEKVRLQKRIRPTLELVGRACRALDAKLAGAAAAAAKKPRAERAALLGAAQAECTLPDPAAPAQTVAEACAPRDGEPQGDVLRDLDAGTYAFVRALRSRLLAEGPLDKDADLVLSSLALAVALEGEAARAPPARR